MGILGVETKATVPAIHVTATTTTARGMAKEHGRHRRIAPLLGASASVSVMTCRIEVQALPAVGHWAQQQLRKNEGVALESLAGEKGQQPN